MDRVVFFFKNSIRIRILPAKTQGFNSVKKDILPAEKLQHLVR